MKNFSLLRIKYSFVNFFSAKLFLYTRWYQIWIMEKHQHLKKEEVFRLYTSMCFPGINQLILTFIKIAGFLLLKAKSHLPILYSIQKLFSVGKIHYQGPFLYVSLLIWWFWIIKLHQGQNLFFLKCAVIALKSLFIYYSRDDLSHFWLYDTHCSYELWLYKVYILHALINDSRL